MRPLWSEAVRAVYVLTMVALRTIMLNVILIDMFPFYRKTKKTSSTKRKKRDGKQDLVKKLDKVFALYIRLRDCMPNGMGKCISCGKIKPYRELDCGHFFGRTNMATRFDEDNCNAECQGCNRASSDHLIYYQENLIKKIGVSRFSTLRERAHSIKKWDNEELLEKINYYTNEVKRLSYEKGISVNL